MPSKTLPTIMRAEIESKTTMKSCFVTIGPKVYDVTEFLESHPGGEDLILEYGGKDVTEIMADEASHTHSESAYEILDDDCLIGFTATDKVMNTTVKSSSPDEILPLPPSSEGIAELESDNAANGISDFHKKTGMKSADDLSRETDLAEDYKTHKFLDLNRPLLMQVFNGGFTKAFYLEQIHRPRHYKGGASAPLFGNFLEPLSKTAWYVVPIVWLPPVTYGTYLAAQHIGLSQLSFYWPLGLFLWTFFEYVLHRFLFHLDAYLPDNRYALVVHFTLHGIHHYLPMDKLRLVMPPTLFLALATPFWKLAHFIFYWNWYVATAVFCGGIFGYICYDLTHYFLHHKTLPGYYKQLKKYHLEHHFMDYENGFGVTSRFWDWVFGTELLTSTKIIKTA